MEEVKRMRPRDYIKIRGACEHNLGDDPGNTDQLPDGLFDGLWCDSVFFIVFHLNLACEHNLKNIDVDIPRNELVVLTGMSGSGKSSLAFDTTGRPF